MRIEGYFPQENNHSNPMPPRDDRFGLWCCSVDKPDESGEPSLYYNFLEVHPGAAWNTPDNNDRKVVFRVSMFRHVWRESGQVSEIQLGECAILNKRQVRQLRDRLNYLLERM